MRIPFITNIQEELKNRVSYEVFKGEVDKVSALEALFETQERQLNWLKEEIRKLNSK